MLKLFEAVAIIGLIAMSVAGFTAAVVWTFAVWFDRG